MLNIDIPGWGDLTITNAVFDFNGTLAQDGKVIPGVVEALDSLSKTVNLHVITADTYRTVEGVLPGFISLHTLKSEEHITEKALLIRELGSHQTVAVGNGRNDRMMLKEARIGIVVIQAEGASIEALSAADIAVTDILDAINLLNFPTRLKATLRG